MVRRHPPIVPPAASRRVAYRIARIRTHHERRRRYAAVPPSRRRQRAAARAPSCCVPARPIPARRRTTAAVILIAALAATGCAALANDQTAGTKKPPAVTAPSRSPAALQLQGEPARAAAAVGALALALKAGDIGQLCEPDAIFTAAVVAAMNVGGESCEASDETSAAIAHPPALAVVGLRFEPDLATAQVSVQGRIVPIDLVRQGDRWLVSFSDGDEPLGALLP